MNLKLENFSTLSARLREVEAEHVETDDGGAWDARRAVVEALKQYYTSRYRLGEALAAYKVYFAADHSWMAAANVIGEAMGRSERTIRNIIADYLRLAELPEAVIVAAEAASLNLAERKHAPLVERIEADLAGSDAPTLPEARQILGRVLEMSSAPKVVLDRTDKIRWTVRLKIRTALTNVAADRKLEELIAALEEEMHAVWGVTEPITVTITPRPGTLDITGRRVTA